MKKIIIIIGLSAILFNSCKKYEDGPLISFRSPTNRLLGKWEVESVSINGVDNTSVYIDSCGCRFSFHSEKHTPIYFALFDCNDAYSYAGSFHFVDYEYIDIFTSAKCNTDTCIYNDTIPIFGPFRTMISSNWDVKKLSNKNMWIENNNDGFTYLFKMKKYEKDNN